MTVKLRAPAASPDDGSTAPSALHASEASRWSYRQDLRDLYRAGRQPTRLVVPPRQFVAVLGSGDPDANPWYGVTIAALYQAAYRIRFGARRELRVQATDGREMQAPQHAVEIVDRSGRRAGRPATAAFAWRRHDTASEEVPVSRAASRTTYSAPTSRWRTSRSTSTSRWPRRRTCSRS